MYESTDRDIVDMSPNRLSSPASQQYYINNNLDVVTRDENIDDDGNFSYDNDYDNEYDDNDVDHGMENNNHNNDETNYSGEPSSFGNINGSGKAEEEEREEEEDNNDDDDGGDDDDDKNEKEEDTTTRTRTRTRTKEEPIQIYLGIREYCATHIELDKMRIWQTKQQQKRQKNSKNVYLAGKLVLLFNGDKSGKEVKKELLTIQRFYTSPSDIAYLCPPEYTHFASCIKMIRELILSHPPDHLSSPCASLSSFSAPNTLTTKDTKPTLAHFVNLEVNSKRANLKWKHMTCERIDEERWFLCDYMITVPFSICTTFSCVDNEIGFDVIFDNVEISRRSLCMCEERKAPLSIFSIFIPCTLHRDLAYYNPEAVISVSEKLGTGAYMFENVNCEGSVSAKTLTSHMVHKCTVTELRKQQMFLSTHSKLSSTEQNTAQTTSTSPMWYFFDVVIGMLLILTWIWDVTTVIAMFLPISMEELSFNYLQVVLILTLCLFIILPIAKLIDHPFWASWQCVHMMICSAFRYIYAVMLIILQKIQSPAICTGVILLCETLLISHITYLAFVSRDYYNSIDDVDDDNGDVDDVDDNDNDNDNDKSDETKQRKLGVHFDCLDALKRHIDDFLPITYDENIFYSLIYNMWPTTTQCCLLCPPQQPKN